MIISIDNCHLQKKPWVTDTLLWANWALPGLLLAGHYLQKFGFGARKSFLFCLCLSKFILGAMGCVCIQFFSWSVSRDPPYNILPKYKLHLFSPLRRHSLSARNRNCHPTPEVQISSSITTSWFLNSIWSVSIKSPNLWSNT